LLQHANAHPALVPALAGQDPARIDARPLDSAQVKQAVSITQMQ